MATSYPPAVVLGLIALIGTLTFAIRLSFIALFGRLDRIPPRVQRGLRFVPAAVLTALVMPSLVVVGPAGDLAVDRLVAGGLAAAVAWRTEDILATMAAGMGAIWMLQLVG